MHVQFGLVKYQNNVRHGNKNLTNQVERRSLSIAHFRTIELVLICVKTSYSISSNV